MPTGGSASAPARDAVARASAARHALLEFGGVGRLPRGPASAATVAGAALVALARPSRVEHAALVAAAIVGGALATDGQWSAEEPDPQRIVIDEVAGVWTALLGIPITPGRCVAAAVVFRVLDKLKPGPIGFVDRLGGKWSIMGDDLLAGAIANLVLRAWIAVGRLP